MVNWMNYSRFSKLLTNLKIKMLISICCFINHYLEIDKYIHGRFTGILLFQYLYGGIHSCDL